MTRVLSGVVLAAGFFTIVWFGTTPLLLAVALIVCGLAFHEYAALMRRLDAEPPRRLALVSTLVVLGVVSASQVGRYVPLPAVFALSLIAIAIVEMASMKPAPDAATARRGFGSAIMATASGAFAMLYLGLPLGALVVVHERGGRGAVLLLVATVAISDTAQYYAGRTFGRRPLAPRLSPKKTIEGALGGFVAAPIFLALAGPSAIPGATPLAIAPLGVALVVAGIAGDLFESMIKRAADVKDSSTLIPGHGGVLDRIDALLFATPIYVIYLGWLLHWPTTI